jgi:hypothetical protein
VDQVNATFKKHIGSLSLSMIKRGDFRKAGEYQKPDPGVKGIRGEPPRRS